MKIYQDEMVKVAVATVCDITKEDAQATLQLNFGYGSPRDGDVLYLDLSGAKAEEILQLLIDKYGETIIKSNVNTYIN